jgi:ABC-type transport system involved in multi-copper enzyme maturation permease subunit
MHAFSLIPGAVMIFLQVAVIIAVSVAVSTRLGVVMNLVICAVIFVTGHMSGYLRMAVEQRGVVLRWGAKLLTCILPAFYQFNITDALAYRKIGLPPPGPGEKYYLTHISWEQVAEYVGWASIYALIYIVLALTAALLLFRKRELA